jgi:hypothetical protein
VSPDRDLILASAGLARTSPENWKRFLGALRIYTDTYRDNCIQSPLETLPVAQGRAQSAAHLYNLLASCIASADKIEGKSK